MSNGKPSSSVGFNYVPKVSSKAAEDQYETLSNVINEITKYHVTITCGGFNAHLGESAVRYTSHRETNKNDQLFLNHAKKCKLHITSTLLKKRKEIVNFL